MTVRNKKNILLWQSLYFLIIFSLTTVLSEMLALSRIILGRVYFVGKKCDSDGEIKIEPKYDNADSFCAGIAPVCKDGKWGYIDVNEKYAIEPIFDEARCFNTRGIAAVKTDEKWKFIQLRTYIQ